MHSRHSLAVTLHPSNSSVRTRAVLIREYEAGDELAILRAFNAVNGALDEGFAARSLAQWRWRFLDNPAGRRVVLAFDEEGALLAQYAGLPQRAWVAGAPAILTQGIDSFSVPAARGLGRRGTFVQTGERFAELYGGPAGRGDPWMWGLPVASARRVGQRFLGYVPLRSQPLLELEASVALASGAQARPVSWDDLDSFEGALEVLGAEHAARCGALALRVAAQLAWRFARRPGGDYELALCLRADGSLAGFGVYRAARLRGRRVGLLCDGLFDASALGELSRWAARCARRDGLGALWTAVPPWCEAFADLQKLGWRVRPSKLVLVGRSFERSLGVSFWERRWYYTLADSDLV